MSIFDERGFKEPFANAQEMREASLKARDAEIITAWLDGIQNDPEVMERVKSEMWSYQATTQKPLAYWCIEALKQEVDR